jgi:hypothetical protein
MTDLPTLRASSFPTLPAASGVECAECDDLNIPPSPRVPTLESLGHPPIPTEDSVSVALVRALLDIEPPTAAEITAGARTWIYAHPFK